MKINIKLLLGVSVIMIIIVAAALINSAIIVKKRINSDLISYREHLFRESKLNIKSVNEGLRNSMQKIYSEYVKQGKDDDYIKKILKYMVNGTRYGDTGYVTINDLEDPPRMIMHPIIPALNGSTFSDKKFNVAMNIGERTLLSILEDDEYAEKVKNFTAGNLIITINNIVSEKGEGFTYYMWPKPGEEEPQPKINHGILFEEYRWVLTTGVYIDDIEKKVQLRKAELNKDFYNIIFSGIFYAIIILVISLIVLTILVNRLIIKKLVGLTGMVYEISEGEGDLTKRLPIESKDEIGILSKNFNVFIEKLNSLIGDLKNNIVSLDQMSLRVAVSTTESVSTLTELTSTTASVSKNTDNQTQILQEALNDLNLILSGVKEISSMSDEIEIGISQSSTSIEEMASNIANTSEISSIANVNAEELANVSKVGGESIDNLINATNEVAENSKKIEEMVTLISDISSQTDLLAMNAAIEAAHAGDAGKGFAVVADEIRKLADRSSQGAKQIQEVVSLISNNTSYNIGLANNTRDSFDTILKNVEKVKIVNNEILAAMNEQKSANQVILESILKLKSLGEEIALRAGKQMENSKKIERSFDMLKNISIEVNTSMNEQSLAMKSITDKSEELSRIANDMKGVSDIINKNFGKFKTE